MNRCGHFVLPRASWWTDYYAPKAARLGMLRERYRGEPDVLTALDESERELAVHRRYGHLYDYVFFVAGGSTAGWQLRIADAG